jgi:uncharacterized protein DUF4412
MEVNPMIHFKCLFLILVLTAVFGAACSGAKNNSTTGSSSTASGDSPFEGEIKSKMSMVGPEQMEVRYTIKGSRMRTETRLSTQTSITLMDLSSGESTMLYPQTKTYMTLGTGEISEEMVKKAENAPPIDFPKVTSTGKTESIAGHTCQYWQFGDKMQMCLAQGLGYYGGGSSGILDKLKKLGQGDKYKAQLNANPEFAKFAEGGAFPLKMISSENGESKTLMEVTSVERKSLEDSLFTVPADYKKTELPEIPRITGTKR